MPNTPDPTPLALREAPNGLTYHDVVLDESHQNEFEDLQASLQAELQPQGPLEHDVFDQLLHASWNLRRVRRLEAKLSPDCADPLLDDGAAPTLARLARCHDRSERSYYRALRELRALQTERALRAQLQPQPALPALASMSKRKKRTQRTPPPPPNSQILQSSNPPILPGSLNYPHVPSPPP
jgi:hypothetical protein